jgi:hypothetical protein
MVDGRIGQKVTEIGMIRSKLWVRRGGIGMKLTEIGMIFSLHRVRTEQGLGFVELQDSFGHGAEELDLVGWTGPETHAGPEPGRDEMKRSRTGP